jgi:DNA replication factor GINS
MVQNIVTEVGKEGFTTADQYIGKQISTNENKNDYETVFVRITEDIPTFLGSNERIYSLTKEDIVSLPKDNAELLCKGGKAVRIT